MVNSEKSKLILFSRRRNDKGQIKLFGVVFTPNHLGMMSDRKLSRIPHAEYTFNKAAGIFWMCRNAFDRTFGLTPKTVLWINTGEKAD